MTVIFYKINCYFSIIIVGKYMKRIILTLAACFLIFQLSAQENNEKIRTITVDDAVLLATDNNISIKIQKSKLNTLKRKNTFFIFI